MSVEPAQRLQFEAQQRFWNDWDIRHLSEATLGREALRRGQTVMSLLLDCSIKRPKILEFGCGNGWLTEKLASVGAVTGVDIADLAIVEARRRVPEATFMAGDALSMSLPVGAFDVAVTLEMFSHVASQSRFAEVIACSLREGGFLILTTQNRTVYMRRNDVAPLAEGQIRRWVTMRELRRVLEPYFKIIRASTIQPSGNRGFLRIVNSPRLNGLASNVIPESLLAHWKERCGLGQTLVVLAQKRT